MADIFYIIGEVLLILALIGLIGVLVWLVMTVLHAKKAVMTDAGRLYKRPLNAGKNLVITVKGIAQQETVRAKRVIAAVKGTTGEVKHSVGHIQAAAKTVHPEDLRPALSTVQNISKILSLAAQFSRSASKQRPSR